MVERQQRSREERTKEKRGETVLERRLGERISGLRTRVEDTDDAVRVWNGHRAPDEVAAEYYGAIGKGAQDVDQRMRGYLRAALEAMETSESRIMDAFAAWNAQHLAADSLLASMISGEERSRPAFESEGEAAEAYVRWGEAARKILAEEAVRWVRSGAASGAIPADCAAEVLKHFAGEDPTATPEARAEQNKFEMENLGREAAMMSAATLGGRSYMVSRQARGGPDDAAAPATRVSESAKSAPFQFLTGDPRRDALLSESEGAPGPSLSADSDWASVGDARGAQPAPGDMLEQGGAVRLDAEEAEKREMRMREALGLIAEAERIYESKVAAGDESARAPAAEARELARRLATSPSQFLDSRKVEMLAVSAIAGAVLFGGVGALAYAFDVLGTRGLTEKMASTFARAKVC